MVQTHTIEDNYYLFITNQRGAASDQLQLTTMKKVITFTSAFNIGDIVTYDDRITKSFTSTIVDIKFTDSYQYMYKFQDKPGVWFTEKHLTNDTEAKSS